MYECFDHTADLGLRIRAPDLSALFNDAGRGLFSIIVEDLETVAPRQQHSFEMTADDLEYLLFDWLDELLGQFDPQRMLFSEFDVHVTGQRLAGVARGEPYDPARHHLAHEVKAITYHGLSVQQNADGWVAEAIVDI